MNLPGGDLSMLGQWRVVMKQAEESARSGRLDEALRLVSRPDVADTRPAIQLRAKLAQELVDRARRRAQADDVPGAIADLSMAERAGSAPDTLAAARLAVGEQLAAEIQLDLDSGSPERVAERVERLAAHAINGPGLRRLKEAAEAWQVARAEARRGEFGRAAEQLDRAARLAGATAQGAISEARNDLDRRQQASHPRVERLYQTLSGGQWHEVLAAAESVLEVVPEHPAARQARTRAWQQVGAINPAAAAIAARSARPAVPPPPMVAPRSEVLFLDEPVTPAPRTAAAEPVAAAAAEPTVLRIPQTEHAAAVARPAYRAFDALAPATIPATGAERACGGLTQGRFLFWVDDVGGYLVCLDEEIVIGRAGPDAVADVPLLADISRRHASIVRDGDGYVVHAYYATFLNGKPVEGAALKDGDILRLGASVELEFRQPSPASSTARLRVVSRHRLPVAVDGVLLMAQTCIVGPGPQSHVVAPNLDQAMILYRQAGGLWCRAREPFRVDGGAAVSRSALGPRACVVGDGLSFSLEPLGAGDRFT